MTTRSIPFALALAGLCLLAQAQSAPTVRLRELPEPLRAVWERTKPEMTEPSRCAAAFDPGDRDRMALRCSVYVRLGAEAERRALRHCEEARQELHIKGPCAIVKE